MFSWYKYLIVSLVFSHLGFWSGNLFLIAPFPDLAYLYFVLSLKIVSDTEFEICILPRGFMNRTHKVSQGNGDEI